MQIVALVAFCTIIFIIATLTPIQALNTVAVGRIVSVRTGGKAVSVIQIGRICAEVTEES